MGKSPTRTGPTSSKSTTPEKGDFGHPFGLRCRAALYARISTHDQQTLGLQLTAMRRYARERAWNVVREASEVGSGASVRPERDAILELARRRQIDVVVVWRLDRWGRSMADL